MPDDPQIPDHRATAAMRSGDTHVIGDDGTARNVDQEARDQAAAEAAAPEPVAPAPSRRGAPDPLPPVQLTAGDDPAPSSDA